MSPATSSALTTRLLGASFAVCLTALGSPVFASGSGCSDTAETDASVSNQSSQVVSVDPDTGALTRTARPADHKPVQRDTGPVETKVLPDGTVTANVGDRFRSHLVAEMVDGKLVTCHKPYEHIPEPTDNSEKADE